MTTNTVNIPYITGASLVCSNATYTVENLPTGARVEWSASNSNLSLLSGQGTSRAIFQKRGNGSTEVNATVNINNQSIALKKENIWVGEPIFSLEGETDLFPKAPGFAEINYLHSTISQQYVTEVTWDYLGPLSFLWGDNFNAKYRASRRGGNGSIYAKVYNGCGSTSQSLGFYVDDSYWIKVYPNPATSEISIEIHEPQEEKERLKARQTISQTPYELQLWNATTMLKRLKTTEKTTQMHLGNLPKGIYFLHLIKDGKAHKQMIKLE